MKLGEAVNCEFRIMNKKKIKNIIKKELNLILEEFVAGVESDWATEYREIFVNPTGKEILDLKNIEVYGYNSPGTVRFTAFQKEEKVYIVAADVVHGSMANEISLKHLDLSIDFLGIGKIVDDEIIPVYFSDQYHGEGEMIKKIKKAILSGKFDWLEKYNFDLSEFKRKIEGKRND